MKCYCSVCSWTGICPIWSSDKKIDCPAPGCPGYLQPIPYNVATPITAHEGNKYLRTIRPAVDIANPIRVDVYAVLEAFGVTCPARAHAIKKLLCAGIRGKGNELDDLKGVLAAVNRAIELQQARDTTK